MRKFLLTILFASAATLTFAQANFYKLGVAAGLGGNYTFADVKERTLSYGGYIALDYYFTPFITAGLEVQKGVLKGGNEITNAHLRQFENSYLSYTLNAKAALGQFIDYDYSDFLNYTKGFYVGTGIGIINNNMTKIVRIKPDGSNYQFPGKDKSSNIVIPINVGIDFHLFDNWGDVRYILNANLQNNITIGEGLDGYNDPQVIFKNNSPDIYTFFSVGFKYNFGPTGLSSKVIR